VRIVVLALLLCTTRIAGATKYAPPEERDEPSPNGAYVVHVDPKGKLHVVRRGTTPQWSFTREVGFDTFFVANDGKTVAVVRWHLVKLEQLDEPAVELWTQAGLARTYSVRELVAQPARPTGVAPIGGFWRRWRTGVHFDGRFLDVETTGLYAYRFDLDGDVERSLAASGALRWAASLGCLAIAFALGWLARSARRALEYASDRNRVALAAFAPIVTALGLAFYLGGVPFAPAELVAPITFALWIAGMLLAPVSLIVRKTGRVWLVATLVLVPASVVLRLV
jgi:hypothetical protein